jgi:coenzyme F420-0:L-glutamate ligase/coenzyme F420-1:gamma-L-glutamate ligase
VKGKAEGVPVAVVRGLRYDDDGRGAQALVRPAAADWFRLGTVEAHQQTLMLRRTVREFAGDPVDRSLVLQAIGAALTAPAPHHTTPWRFVLVEERREPLLAAMATAWQADLAADGLSEEQVSRRLQRGALLSRAPYLVVPCLVRAGAHDYPDARRRLAEERMFVVSGGAGVENLLVQLAALGLGSAWVGSTLFCPEVVRAVLDLEDDWEPLGAVAIGWPAREPEPRGGRDPGDYVVVR